MKLSESLPYLVGVPTATEPTPHSPATEPLPVDTNLRIKKKTVEIKCYGYTLKMLRK